MNDQALELRDLSRQYRDKEGSAGASSPNASSRRRRIVVMSGKGGVGKSFLSIEIACALARKGRRVLLVDANPHSPSLHVLTNEHTVFSSQDLLAYGRQPEQLSFPEITPNVSLLANAKIDVSDSVTASTNAAFFLESLAPYTASYDCVVFDTHTGIDDWNAGIIETASDVFVVTLTEPASIIDTYSLVKGAFQYVSGENFWLLISQTLNRQSGTEAHEKLNLALKHFLSYEIPLLGMIPFDFALKTSIDEQAPFWEKPHCGIAAKHTQDIVNNYLIRILENETSKNGREVIL